MCQRSESSISHHGEVAQLVEHQPEELGVVGSMPTLPTICSYRLIGKDKRFSISRYEFESRWEYQFHGCVTQLVRVHA